ncbi:MAG: thioredoxin family protein [Terriglobales bacterium]|jgi:glutaredoxin
MNTEQNRPGKQQQCSVAGLFRIWAGYAAGLAVFAYSRNRTAFLFWLVLVPVGKLVEMRFFSYFSRFFGYGRIENDVPAANVAPTSVSVTYYSALGCPFCPIVLRRLLALQKQMGFVLQSINVSLNPQMMASRGIRSVPVVEVGEQRLVGNVTSEQLARLIGLPQTAEAAAQQR